MQSSSPRTAVSMLGRFLGPVNATSQSMQTADSPQRPQAQRMGLMTPGYHDVARTQAESSPHIAYWTGRICCLSNHRRRNWIPVNAWRAKKAVRTSMTKMRNGTHFRAHDTSSTVSVRGGQRSQTWFLLWITRMVGVQPSGRRAAASRH